MRRAERAEVEAVAEVLRQVVEQVQDGTLDASAPVLRRVEGALIALDTLSHGQAS